MSLFKRARSTATWLSLVCLICSGAGCGRKATSPATGQATGSDARGAPTEEPIPADSLGTDGSHNSANEGPSDQPSKPETGKTADTPRVNPEADEALWEASHEGRYRDVKQALEKGARVRARDLNGNTALMLAVFNGHEEVARLLIERNAEVNAVNPDGRTPLMFAATFDDPRTVELLLANGAKVNVRERTEGFTALMFAAAEGHIDVVKLLLDHDADRTLKDVDGDTAADFARKNGHTEVVKALN